MCVKVNVRVTVLVLSGRVNVKVRVMVNVSSSSAGAVTTSMHYTHVVDRPRTAHGQHGDTCQYGKRGSAEVHERYVRMGEWVCK